MNGVHDMGGMDGFGKVEAEPNEPVFHADWEARTMALVRAMGAAGAFNIDTSRFYRESLPPHVYLNSSYYKKWLLGLEDNLIAKGFVSRAEVAKGHASEPAKPQLATETVAPVDKAPAPRPHTRRPRDAQRAPALARRSRSVVPRGPRPSQDIQNKSGYEYFPRRAPGSPAPVVRAVQMGAAPV